MSLSELSGRYSYACSGQPQKNEKFLPLSQTFPDKGSLYFQWSDHNRTDLHLCLTNKTKIYGSINNRAYYQIAEIKRCLRAHTIKSSEEMLQNLIAHKRNSKAKASANVQ